MTDLFDWKQARDTAMTQVKENSGESFYENAMLFVIEYLRRNGAASGEKITDACKNAGIVPHDDRAFGPVYMSLMRRGEITKCGHVIRKKGHGTSGGNIWTLAL